MQEAKFITRRPPLEHAKILAVVFRLYGGFNAFVLGLMLTLSLGALLSSGGRAWENDLVSDGVTGSLSALPFFVVMPFVAAYGLSKKRRWAKIFVMVSGTVALLLSLFMAYVSFDEGEFGGAVYYVPCLAMSLYSYWFVFPKPAV